MTIAEEQIALVAKRSSIPSMVPVKDGHGKSYQLPLTSNYDVWVVGAYWFGAMRALFLDSEPQIEAWTSVESVEGEGHQWHLVEGFLESVSDDAPLPSVDVYLALPAFPLLDKTRRDPSERFMRGASYNDVDEANLLTWQIKSGEAWTSKEAMHLYVERGWLYQLKSNAQKYYDTSDSYNHYLQGVVGLWDELITLVSNTTNPAKYANSGDKNEIGKKYATVFETQAFWSLVLRINEATAQNRDVLNSMPGFADFVTDVGGKVKSAGASVIQAGGEAAGTLAADVANTAGKALGGGIAEFMDNVGVWGIAFVAALIVVYR